MTKLSQRKSRLVVETSNAVYDRRRQREIILELKPGYMILRLKGARRNFPLSYTSALNLAIRNQQAQKRLEREKKRRVS